MKIIVDRFGSYGNIELTYAIKDYLGISNDLYDCRYIDKYAFDERLFEFVKEHPFSSKENPKLQIVDIPDNVSDWTVIDNNDGCSANYVIYVLDGKLYIEKDGCFCNFVRASKDIKNRYFGGT